MSARFYAPLAARAAVRIAGDDRIAFLQGLVSSDAAKIAPDRALHAGFLTAQGRFLHEFFMAADGEAVLLDCEAARREDLLRRLKIYKLRAKVALSADDGFVVAAFWGDGAAEGFGLPATAGAAKALGGGIVYVDPRLSALGVRALVPAANLAGLAKDFAPSTVDAYDALRLAHGVPDGSRDLAVEGALLLENGFEELGGVDFKKGCYVGQEVTARMKYRALIRKRLLPVAISGPAPAVGTPILQDGADVGEMRSSADGQGLALLRLEALEKTAALVAGEATLVPHKPAWANF
jgi:folate-binding protein YgfZ